MKKDLFENVFISEAKDLLIATDKTKDGKTNGDEVCSNGVEQIYWDTEDETDEKQMTLIGKAIKVGGAYLFNPKGKKPNYFKLAKICLGQLNIMQLDSLDILIDDEIQDFNKRN